jgi:hypothetical protein
LQDDSHFEWDDPDNYAGSEPEEILSEQRDPVIDAAKEKLRSFFDKDRASVFYQRQLQVIFEAEYFHWITARALNELVKEQVIAGSAEVLPGVGSITIYRARSHRFWKRQAREIIDIVARFSASDFTHAVGAHGELMFDAALPTAGFLPTARKVRSYRGKSWTLTGHDLDRIYERDGVSYGTEIKNTLDYIPKDELYQKIEMCKFLGIRPLFIVRMAPKNYIYDVMQAGGFTLIFKYQLYPLGERAFAEKVRSTLRLPIGCPTRIEDGTCKRFLDWHIKNLAR